MTLEEERDRIAEIDLEIIKLIAKRQNTAAEIASLKHRFGISVRDEAQKKNVITRAFDAAVENRIDPVSVGEIFKILIAMNEERQRECSGEGNLP